MTNVPERLETTLGRAAWALCLGALAGAALVGLGWGALAGIQQIGSRQTGGLPGGLIIVGLAFGFAVVTYAAGLALAAAPLWALLHAIGVRSWWAAMLLGAFLNGGVILLVQGASIRRLPAIFVLDAAFALFGAIVGWVIWRAAYRRRLDIDALSETLS